MDAQRKWNSALMVAFCLLLTIFLLLLSYKLTLLFVGLTPDQQNTLDFLKEKSKLPLNLSLGYTPDELSHLQDVQKLMKGADILFYILLLVLTLIITVFRKERKLLKELFRKGGITTLIALLVIFGFTLLSFDQSFVIFHNLFFPQGNWLFPEDSLLIQTFPLYFFTRISTLIFIGALVGGIIFILVSFNTKELNTKESNIKELNIKDEFHRKRP